MIISSLLFAFTELMEWWFECVESIHSCGRTREREGDKTARAYYYYSVWQPPPTTTQIVYSIRLDSTRSFSLSPSFGYRCLWHSRQHLWGDDARLSQTTVVPRASIRFQQFLLPQQAAARQSYGFVCVVSSYFQLLFKFTQTIPQSAVHTRHIQHTNPLRIQMQCSECVCLELTTRAMIKQ